MLRILLAKPMASTQCVQMPIQVQSLLSNKKTCSGMAHSELTEYDDVEKYLVSIVNSALAGKTCKSVTACSGIVLYRKSHKNSNYQMQFNISTLASSCALLMPVMVCRQLPWFSARYWLPWFWKWRWLPWLSSSRLPCFTGWRLPWLSGWLLPCCWQFPCWMWWWWWTRWWFWSPGFLVPMVFGPHGKCCCVIVRK